MIITLPSFALASSNLNDWRVDNESKSLGYNGFIDIHTSSGCVN
jgi:hypothetical protein